MLGPRLLLFVAISLDGGVDLVFADQRDKACSGFRLWAAGAHGQRIVALGIRLVAELFIDLPEMVGFFGAPAKLPRSGNVAFVSLPQRQPTPECPSSWGAMRRDRRRDG